MDAWSDTSVKHITIASLLVIISCNRPVTEDPSHERATPQITERAEPARRGVPTSGDTAQISQEIYIDSVRIATP